MVPRPPPLLSIWYFQRPPECQWMRPGQDGERRESLWVLIRDLPSKAGFPVMADS
jgi:hypothetical protein